MDMEVCLYLIITLGKQVAEFCKKHFPKELKKEPKFAEKDYQAALINTFLKMDVLLNAKEGREEIKKMTEESYEKERSQPMQMGDEGEGEGPDMMGCTANVIFIKDNKIYIANAGDSRSIAMMKDGKVEELSSDHKPEKEIETKRIHNAGGAVINGRVDGNLNLSRAIGDLQYKSNASLEPKDQMICSYPDVVVKDLTPDFDFIVMGCDGIYETKSSQEIGEIVSNEAKVKPTAKLTDLAAKLMDTIISPDFTKTNGAGCDNMTCIIIKFKHS
jgi:serine/threonine protein phosphatase PrpC